MNVTPAMKRWVKDLASGKLKVERTSVTNARASGMTGRSGFTYVMGSKLEDAGLIVWEPETKLDPRYSCTFACPSHETPQKAVLTEAGRKCAA